MWIRLTKDCTRQPPGELFPRQYRAGDIVDADDQAACRAIRRGLAVIYQDDRVRIPEPD